MIAKRIRHKDICDHAQTPYARRKCRAAKLAAAKLAAAIEAAKPAAPTYQPGDSIDIDGTEIILSAWRGNNGLRWRWHAPDLDVTGMTHKATPEEAIADARRKLGDRCACGAVAEMTSATKRTCTAHYDRYAA